MFNYINHIIYDNKYYQHRFENDLPKLNYSKGVEMGKRVMLIALPFISLYGPAGKGLGVTMGSMRCITHLFEGGIAIYHKNFWDFGGHMAQTVLAVMAVAATLFSFRVGLLITTIADIGVSLKTISSHLIHSEFKKALVELTQAASSMLYLSIMLTDSLELTLASVLLQGAISLYQAKDEWNEGRWPEFFAKLTMGMLRFNQAIQYVDQIKQRNALLVLDKYIKLMEQVKKGRNVSHLIDSPLQNTQAEMVMLDANGNPIDFTENFLCNIKGNAGKGPLQPPADVIDEKNMKDVIMTDSKNNQFNFGANVHGYGKGLVKGMNLQFRSTVIDGKNMKEIDFKVNHVFRKQIQTIIDGMKDFSPDEMKSFLQLTQSHARNISIKKVPFELCSETKNTMGEAYQMTFDGLGKVIIGASADLPNMYDRVRFVIDKDKSVYDVHEMMTFLNLDDAFRTSSEDDIQRLKIGHLYRTFYPCEATLLERCEEYFELPIDELKARVISINPQMQSIMEEMLPKMTTKNILPGRLRYAIPQISKMVYERGGRMLVSTITGASHSSQEAYQRFASILKMGLISSDVRYRNGMTVGGLSPSSDFYTGGADSVFTQFLTEKEFTEKMSLNNLYYGQLRVLISLDALNTGSYQYHSDSYGTRRLDDPSFDFSNTYLNRENILNFTEQESQYFHHGNEVMLKERLDPSLIKGVIVPTTTMRNELLEMLKCQGLVSKKKNVETIMNIPVDKFIQVGNHLSDSMLK